MKRIEIFCEIKLATLITLIVAISTASFASDQYVKPGATGSGASWDDALGSIQAGINAAGAGNTVYVACGTYAEAITMKSGVSVRGGYEGLSGFPGVCYTHHGATIIDGSAARNGYPAYHVVMMDSVTDTLLEGFTIAGGIANGVSDDFDGAGVYCTGVNETNTISRCWFSNNIANQYGAGMYLYSSSPVVTDCLFSGNSAQTSGGGMYADSSDMAVTNCVFSGNAASKTGGGMDLSSSDIAMTYCVISGNFTNGAGAGMRISESNIAAMNCAMINNTAKSGAACMSVNSSDIEITNCIISYNQGDSDSCLNFYQSQLSMTNCTLNGNQSESDYGGGITLSDESQAEIVNTIFSNNKHAIYIVSDIWLGDSVLSELSHCLFYNNTDGDYYDSVSGSLTGSNAINLFVGATSDCYSGDPLFIDETNYDFHLQNGSAALDRGLLSSAPAADVNDVPRPGTDGLADIGAYEAPAEYLPSTVDVFVPISYISTALPLCVASQVVDIPFLASDMETGIQYVRLYYRKDGGDWMQYDGDYTASPISFNSSSTGGDGNYEFYTQATDNAGNVEPAPTIADADTMVSSAFTGPVVYVNPDGADNGMGANWENACNRISSALLIAEAHGVPEVWVAQGTIYEAITLPSNVALRGGYAGTGDTRDIDAYVTTINGETASEKSVVTMSGVTSTTLEGFIITEGSTSDNGGGVYCCDADDTNTIADCRITNNNAVKQGGGMYLEYSSPTVTNCGIYSNYTPYRASGGIYLYASQPKLSNCIIALEYHGGINIDYSSYPRLENCSIFSNGGGGVNISNNSKAMITNCMIDGNYLEWWTGDGGGINGRILTELPKLCESTSGDEK
ncbi:right-handed parallel beta-helix repeat-containing protein [Candidatus Sumerlaeota bacterium]|nr:right-handed parallel beta-helix repeat-containing protein [Candidatus Sumerlaeota bacterium]